MRLVKWRCWWSTASSSLVHSTTSVHPTAPRGPGRLCPPASMQGAVQLLMKPIRKGGLISSSKPPFLLLQPCDFYLLAKLLRPGGFRNVPWIKYILPQGGGGSLLNL